MHLSMSTLLDNRSSSYGIVKKTNDIRFLISITESQNTLQLSGLQVRLNSMRELTVLLFIYLFIYFVNYMYIHVKCSCVVYVTGNTSRQVQRVITHGWSPCSKLFLGVYLI